MRKHSLVAFTMLAVMSTTAINVQAANFGSNCPGNTGSGYKVITGSSMEEIQEKLAEAGINVDPNSCQPKPCTPAKENPAACPVPETATPQPCTPTAETPTPSAPAKETPAPATPAAETPKPSTPAKETPVPTTPTVTPAPATPENSSIGAEASSVVNLVNQERAKQGASKLTVNAKASAAAMVRAKEIAQSFSHTRPNGSAFSTVLKENGVSYRGCGENIAYGQKTPDAVMTAWMNSSGHRANILNSSYKEIGVACYTSPAGVKYWVQLFIY